MALLIVEDHNQLCSWLTIQRQRFDIGKLARSIRGSSRQDITNVAIEQVQRSAASTPPVQDGEVEGQGEESCQQDIQCHGQIEQWYRDWRTREWTLNNTKMIHEFICYFFTSERGSTAGISSWLAGMSCPHRSPMYRYHWTGAGEDRMNFGDILLVTASPPSNDSISTTWYHNNTNISTLWKVIIYCYWKGNCEYLLLISSLCNNLIAGIILVVK